MYKLHHTGQVAIIKLPWTSASFSITWGETRMDLYELMYGERLAQLLAHIGLPCSSVGKESTCKKRDTDV